MDPCDERPDGRAMRAFLAARDRARRERGRARLHAIEEVLPEVATVLARHGALRAWVFGSVASRQVDEGSDLDLAVEGLPPERFIETRVALAEVVPVAFDLVELERAPEGLRRAILDHGRELLHAA